MQSLEFSGALNCFVGMNGMGKTNLLDAIYYCCMGKSHFGGQDRNVVRHDATFFRLEAHFSKKEKKEKIVAKVIPGKQKVLERNDVPYQRLAEHVGGFPVVIIAPGDTALALDGSEERRRFADNTLSQLDRQYLLQLITYNKVLKLRNIALKQFATHKRFDASLLTALTNQLLEPALIIHEKRTEFVKKLRPVFNGFYQIISGEAEIVDCQYDSKLTGQNFSALLRESTEKDRLLQRTTVGVHKDDLIFTINGFPLKRFASQGQLKSYVLALKLAQYELLKKEKKVLPILLLDDIFDKLDSSRVEHLIGLMLKKDFGQIFITDTHQSRVEEIVKNFGLGYKVFKIERGAALAN